LSKREADMAVINTCPEEGRLFAVKLTDYELGVYASRAYLDGRPLVTSPEGCASSHASWRLKSRILFGCWTPKFE